MTDTLTPYEGKRPLVMKNGLVHWLTDQTAAKLEDHLSKQSGHTFVKVTELNITINTAEIDGLYTADQYEELGKIKDGQWKCQYGNWHNKGKRECECKKEHFRKAEDARKKIQEAEQYGPVTPEKRKLMRANIDRINKNLPWKTDAAAPTPENHGIGECLVCHTKLPSNLWYYCSGPCLVRAKETGIYGNEEAAITRAKALTIVD